MEAHFSEATSGRMYTLHSRTGTIYFTSRIYSLSRGSSHFTSESDFEFAQQQLPAPLLVCSRGSQAVNDTLESAPFFLSFSQMVVL
jgi:hypothetical protein